MEGSFGPPGLRATDPDGIENDSAERVMVVRGVYAHTATPQYNEKHMTLMQM